jgi:glycosyltransferase involved in cell wall biosynthesis
MSKTMSDKKAPRVSIGMPVYNSEKYLKGALDSVLAQTYSDFEIIICDNASTDQTPEICRMYAAKDKRIRYYRNSHNLGANPNINQTFKLSSGEYFKWAFYDDLIRPEFISRCIEVLDQNPEVVLCVPKSNVIDENGRFLGINEYKADLTVSQPHIRFRNIVNTPDAGWEVFGLIRSSVLKQTALHASYPGSDLVLLAELALHGRFHVLSEALLYPRIHPEQMWILVPKERDRVVFEDSSLEGKIVLPKWGWVFGYLQAIKNAPLNIFQLVDCVFTVLRWILRPDHFRALVKDIILAVGKLISKPISDLQSTVVK